MIQRSNGQRLGVTRNRQWSVVGLHDLANGNVVERYAYDMTGKRTIYAANGTTVRNTSSFGNHFGYTSRWHDDESGLMYFRARYYNPLTGEFLRRDPLGFEDGMSLYRGYMGLGWADPTGTAKILCRCNHNNGRWGPEGESPYEEEIDCRGLVENCCKEACRGRSGWTGQHRIKPRPEFAKTNDEDDIPSQDLDPGIAGSLGVYFSNYVFTWETPHPNDPVDLWLTRGKLGAGAVAVGAGGWAAGIVWGPGTLAAGAFYGRSSLSMAGSYGGAAYGASVRFATPYFLSAYLFFTRNPDIVRNLAEEAAYMAAGVPSPLPAPFDARWIGSKISGEASQAAVERLVGRIRGLRAGNHNAVDDVQFVGSRLTGWSKTKNRPPLAESDVDIAIEDWAGLKGSRYDAKIWDKVRKYADEFTAETGIRVELHARSRYSLQRWGECFGEYFE